MSRFRFDYATLSAEVRPKALRLTADLDTEEPRASRARSPSRIEALVRLDMARLRQREASGRWHWSGRRITITAE